MQKPNNLQEIFLTQVRRDRRPVTMFLMNGYQMRGYVTGFDAFTVVLSSDGKQMTYGGSGTSISLTDSGSDVTLTCGNGTASVAFSESRQLFMRDNNPAQFRVYSTNNLTSSGYCSVITFYKLG